jgi:hypothetical protein
MTELALGIHVYIRPLERKGRIIGIFTGMQATEYQVRYFDNAEAKTDYFFADELEAA